jgi:agmatinase
MTMITTPSFIKTLQDHTVPQFIGAEVRTNYQDSQFVILPIPFEKTTTYRKGCCHGPRALLTASDQLECYDEELEVEVCHQVGIHTLAPIADTRPPAHCTSEEMLQVVQETVAQLIADGKFIIGLGGEHSITAGIVKAYHENFTEPFTVIQIDAHGDLRFSYEGSIHNHACVMRRIIEMGIPSLPVGIRSICQEEADLIKAQQIPVIWARDIAMQGDWIESAIAQIKTPHVFITIDVDGIDPSLMPGVGTPEPGGLSWYTLLNFLKRVFETYNVIGCDVTELAPVADSVVSQFSAAKLVYKLIAYQAKSQGWLT